MAKVVSFGVNGGLARGSRTKLDARPCETFCETPSQVQCETLARPLTVGSNEPEKIDLARPFSKKCLDNEEKRGVIGSKGGNVNMSARGFELGSRTKKYPPAGFAYKLSAADGRVYRLSHYTKDFCFAVIADARSGRRLEIFAGVWEDCFV